MGSFSCASFGHLSTVMQCADTPARSNTINHSVLLWITKVCNYLNVIYRKRITCWFCNIAIRGNRLTDMFDAIERWGKYSWLDLELRPHFCSSVSLVMTFCNLFRILAWYARLLHTGLQYQWPDVGIWESQMASYMVHICSICSKISLEWGVGQVGKRKVNDGEEEQEEGPKIYKRQYIQPDQRWAIQRGLTLN